MIINSEIGGVVMMDDFTALLKAMDNAMIVHANMFTIETVDNPYIDNPVYRRLDFGNGDKI